MKIHDKIEYEYKDFIYEGVVIAVSKDKTKVLVSINPLGKVVEMKSDAIQD